METKSTPKKKIYYKILDRFVPKLILIRYYIAKNRINLVHADCEIVK